MTERDRRTGIAAGPPGHSPFAGGAVFGVGSLPHRDRMASASFAITEFDIASIPSLPARSLAEAMIAQAVVGVPGVSLGPRGGIVVDPAQATAGAPISTDLSHDAYAGLRAFLDLARTVSLDGAPVKWQFIGPVTLGVALQRAGLDTESAFALALRAVRCHLEWLSAAITAALPASPQLVILDEPWLNRLMAPDFPIPPDEAIDLMSSGMAAVTPTAVAGIHCCAPSDIATLLASGPEVISIPVSDDLVDWAGYLARFMGNGGVVAWGAVPTEAPVAVNAERHWRALSDLWCALVQHGCDPVTLRRQSLITPSCGLAAHSVAVARRLVRQTVDVARRVKDQAGATRFALGA